MRIMLLLLLISLVSGFILLIIGSLGLVIGQSGLPSPGEVPKPIPNTTGGPNSTPSNPPNTLKSLPQPPFK